MRTTSSRIARRNACATSRDLSRYQAALPASSARASGRTTTLRFNLQRLRGQRCPRPVHCSGRRDAPPVASRALAPAPQKQAGGLDPRRSNPRSHRPIEVAREAGASGSLRCLSRDRSYTRRPTAQRSAVGATLVDAYVTAVSGGGSSIRAVFITFARRRACRRSSLRT